MADVRFPKGDWKAHARLARGMVRRTGVDLGDRVADGQISDQALGSIVTRCQQCPYPGSCAAWQLDHAAGESVPPAYCMNAELFGELPHKT